MKLMKNSLALVLPMALMLMSAPGIAQEEESPLNTEIELGAVVTTGNTDNENINFSAAVEYDRDEWLYGFSVDGFRSSKNNDLTAHRIYYVAKADYSFSDTEFIESRIAHEDDRFSGFDSQSDVSVSYGRNFLNNIEDMELAATFGVGMRRSRLPDQDIDEAILRFSGDYLWSISESADFNQVLSTEFGEESSIFRSESSIETQIVENLALRFSIDVKHQTDVPVGRKKTDTETSITLVMNF